MQIIQPLHRTGRRLRTGRCSLALLLLAPLALNLAWAEPIPSSKPSAAAKPVKPTDKTAAAKTSAVRKLPTIVVTAATRNAQPVGTTATSSTVITQGDLAAGQYVSVADALSKVPGLAVVPSGVPGQITSVFIRGGDSNQTLFTIDGRRQPVNLAGAYDFTNLTLDNVDQIEVVRTPSSSLEGGNAAGGVINLVTLTGRGLDHPESSASFEAGSYDTFRENIQSRGAEGGFDYAVSASDLTANMNRPNENYRNTVYRGNFGYQVTPDVYVDLHTGYSLANAGSPNAIQYPDPVGRLETEDWFISPEVTARVTDFYTTKFYFNHDQERQNFHDLFLNFPAFQFAPVSVRTQIDTNSVDWQNNFRIARNWQLTAGVQGDDTDVYLFDDTVGARTLQNGLSNIGGYLASQWEALPGLNVLSSVRYDHYSDYSGAVSWRQGVAYTIAPTKTLVHASGASAFTPPPAQDLYFPGFSNPNLKPEKSLGWEAGVEQPLLGGKVTPGATYFHNSITDYIQFPPPTFLPQNVGKATTEGVEVDIKAKPIDELALDLNYTYLTASNDSAQARLVRRPRNSLNFTAAWTPVTPLTLSMGGSWVQGREDFDPATFSQIDAPDYFTLRAGATWKINSYVSIWVRGENLTDTHYQPVLGFPALGAAGYGGIKVSF